MNELLHLLASFGIGLLLGLLYFGSLWWSVKRLVEAGGPWWFHPLGALLRGIGVVVGFGWCSAEDPRLLASCFVGWLGARQFLLARLGHAREGERKGGFPCA